MDATKAADVALPIEVVELKDLRTKDGSPVKVVCEKVPETLILQITMGLPGVGPQEGIKKKPEKRTPEEALKEIEMSLPVINPMIEAGTAFVGDDGQLSRPAFWFSEPKPGAIDGRYLSLEDKNALGIVIAKLSGYVAKEVDDASFHDGDGQGSAVGVGAGPAGEEVRQDPVGGAT